MYKACSHVPTLPFTERKPTISLFGRDGTHCFAKKTSRDYEKGKPTPFFLKTLIRHSQSSTPALDPQKHKSFHLSHKLTDSTLFDTVNQQLICILILYTFSLQ